jgi:LysM repeat protein
MSLKNIIITVIISCFALPHYAFYFPNEKITAEQYIAKYKNNAIIEMERYNIPASITLAQAMLESGNGNSELAIKANNHFGIKCHTSWKGETFIKDDDKKDECFRKYESVLNSYNDHSAFLASSSRYAFLFKLDRTDYKSWAKGLKQAGYATNPKYDEILIRVIENHELYKFDSHAQYANTSKPNSPKTEVKTISPDKRAVLQMGIRKYIIIEPGDDIDKIAKETDKDVWQLNKYNDLEKGEKLVAGQKLFLQPKRNKASTPYHTVKEGETMKYISQLHGIKLNKLCRKNNMQIGQEPKAGEVLYLRKNKPTDSF